MKNNKYLYLLISLIIILFTGCDGSDSALKPSEKNETPNPTVVPQKRNPGKEDHLKKAKKP